MLCKPPGDARDVAPSLLVDVGSQVGNRARAIVSDPRAARPPRRALVPPRMESAGGQPLCPAPPESSAPGPSGSAIHRERLNEPEVALARW